MKQLFILVACEESQAVTKELRRLGHCAFSCDIVPTTGGHPEWHIKGDVLRVLNGKCVFNTEDGKSHSIHKHWDCILAFPPCTHLAVSGARHFEKKRQDGRQREAIKFFKYMLNANCKYICVENPVNIIGGDYIAEHFPEFSNLPNCTQKIQPYEYGDPSRKTTCLWLKNLKPLKPTNIVEPKLITYTCKNGKTVTLTFPGIARAMAEQFTKQILDDIENV